MGIIKKHKMAVIVAVSMLIEGLGLFFLLSGGAKDVHAEEKSEHGAVKAGPKGNLTEIELGEFKINNAVQPGSSIRIECKVFAAVESDSDHHDAKGGLPETYAKKKNRIREAIQAVLRKANMDALGEPTLATIKRQIQDAVSSMIGREKPAVQAIIIPEFRVTEI